MIVLAMYVMVAENGAFGVAVGVEVMVGVIIEKGVEDGASVYVGTRVCVSVEDSVGVTVHVASIWMGVSVGVGNTLWAAKSGFRGLKADCGKRKIAT